MRRLIPVTRIAANFKDADAANAAYKTIQEMMQAEGNVFRELAPSIEVEGVKLTISWNRKADKKPHVEDVLKKLKGTLAKGVEPAWEL